MDVPLGSPTRPTWRGRLHLFALLSAIPLLVLLAARADGARARGGVIVYAVGLCTMFAASATYHRFVHSIRARAAWRRVDHAAIYAAIAGTSTAIALVSLGTTFAVAFLVLIWSASLAGAFVKLAALPNNDVIGVVLYLAIGWAGALLLPALWQQGLVPLGLIVGGGVLYTVGAFNFGRQWPKLRPATFSYHEVWHVFTILGASMHFGAVWFIAT